MYLIDADSSEVLQPVSNVSSNCSYDCDKVGKLAKGEEQQQSSVKNPNEPKSFQVSQVTEQPNLIRKRATISMYVRIHKINR